MKLYWQCKMTLKTHTVEKKNPKNNQIWEWEETPEVVKAIEQLHKSAEAVKALVHLKSCMLEPTILHHKRNLW